MARFAAQAMRERGEGTRGKALARSIRYVAPLQQQSVPLLPVALCCAVWPFVAILSALYCNLQYFRFYFLMPRQGRAEGEGQGGVRKVQGWSKS